jgi:hypothetical protein
MTGATLRHRSSALPIRTVGRTMDHLSCFFIKAELAKWAYYQGVGRANRMKRVTRNAQSRGGASRCRALTSRHALGGIRRHQWLQIFLVLRLAGLSVASAGRPAIRRRKSYRACLEPPQLSDRRLLCRSVPAQCARLRHSCCSVGQLRLACRPVATSGNCPK